VRLRITQVGNLVGHLARTPSSPAPSSWLTATTKVVCLLAGVAECVCCKFRMRQAVTDAAHIKRLAKRSLISDGCLVQDGASTRLLVRPIGETGGSQWPINAMSGHLGLSVVYKVLWKIIKRTERDAPPRLVAGLLST
jgi:hypothetical protein